MQLLLLRLLLQLLLVPPSVCLPEWNVGGGVCVLMPVLARLIGGVLPFGRVSAVYVPVLRPRDAGGHCQAGATAIHLYVTATTLHLLLLLQSARIQ